MPPRSKALGLPPAVREELNARLLGNGFSGYEELSQWLAEQGYALSRSGVQRYADTFRAEYEEALTDARQSREIASSFAAQYRDADDGELLAAGVTLAQDAVLRLMLTVKKLARAATDEEGAQGAAKLVGQLTRALADIGRLDLSAQKWRTDLRRQDAAKLDAAVDAGEIDAEAAERARRIIGFA